MTRPQVFIRLIRLLPLFLVLFHGQANALEADNALPIEIVSDRFDYDNKSGIATYSGHVIATQGTRRLTAKRLIVHRKPNGDIEQIRAVGTPARFQSITTPDKPVLHAHASTIEYYPTTEQLNLIDKAQLEQEGDRYSAPLIHYDMAKERITSPASQQGRTRIVLQPHTVQQSQAH